MGYSIGRGRGAHAPRGCAMWGGGAVLHKVKTLRQRARCGTRRLGERVYAEGENEEGKSWEMRRKQGETKIPQSRGACGTRIVFC